MDCLFLLLFSFLFLKKSWGIASLPPASAVPVTDIPTLDLFSKLGGSYNSFGWGHSNLVICGELNASMLEQQNCLSSILSQVAIMTNDPIDCHPPCLFYVEHLIPSPNECENQLYYLVAQDIFFFLLGTFNNYVDTMGLFSNLILSYLNVSGFFILNMN